MTEQCLKSPECCDCAFWKGKCVLEKMPLHIASDPACEKFKPKTGKFESTCDFLRYTR